MIKAHMFQELEKPLSQILVQCVLTHQTSVCYWISAHGQRRVADNWWNSVKSIHITAMEKWKWLISKAALSAPRLTSHQLWQIQPASLVLEHVCTGFIDMYLFFSLRFCPSQAFTIPGQYAFAHQDVSISFWVTDIHPCWPVPAHAF